MFEALQYATLNEERTESTRGTPGERVYFEIDSSVVYPAVIYYLTDAVVELRQLYSEGDPVLFGKALSGNLMARLVAQGRHMVGLVLRVPEEAWELALTPRDQLSTEKNHPDVVLRAQALEAARLFFTEALHQAINNAPMGVHWSKDERFRLDAEGY